MTDVAPMTYHKNSCKPAARLERLERRKALHEALKRGGERSANLDDHRVTTVTTAKNLSGCDNTRKSSDSTIRGLLPEPSIESGQVIGSPGEIASDGGQGKRPRERP